MRRSGASCDSGETYHDFLTRLAQASGIETPTRAELARFDRNARIAWASDDTAQPSTTKISAVGRDYGPAIDVTKRWTLRICIVVSNRVNCAHNWSGGCAK
jgi:hypothetical protein